MIMFSFWEVSRQENNSNKTCTSFAELVGSCSESEMLIFFSSTEPFVNAILLFCRISATREASLVICTQRTFHRAVVFLFDRLENILMHKNRDKTLLKACRKEGKKSLTFYMKT